MRNTDEKVLALLASSLFGVPFTEKVSDWDAVGRECQAQKVSGVANMAAPREAGALQMTADQILAKNINITMAHCRLHNLLSKHKIPYVILKGCASAFYYPLPACRAMGDVDFLVAREDLERTGEVLQQNGFVRIGEDSEHHHEFKKDAIVYELHYAVNGVPEGKMGSIVESYLADTIETAQTRSLKYGHAMLPDEFHHGLIILLHNARHMVSSGMGLRHLCDWAVFVHRVSDFPAMFEQPLREMGLWIYACQMTAVCCRYLGLPGQSWCGSWDDELMEAMIEDIIGAGNFGRKRDDNRDCSIRFNGLPVSDERCGQSG